MSVNSALNRIHVYVSFTSVSGLAVSVSRLTLSVQVGALEVFLFFAAVGVSTDSSAEILAALPRALNASERLLMKEFARPLVAHWALAAASAPGSDVTRWCALCH